MGTTPSSARHTGWVRPRCTTQLLIGAAGAAIWAARGGTRTDISVDIFHALHYLHQTHYVGQSGYPAASEPSSSRSMVSFRPATAATSCSRPGRRTRSCSTGISTSSTAVTTSNPSPARSPSGTRRISNWRWPTPVSRPAGRSPVEWLAHPQGQALARTPPIEIVKLADGDPVPFREDGNWPLDGVRVLDFTHVLAGPRSARTLAEYGAEVLHISSPWFADTRAQHLGVDVGKYDAYLDLRSDEDLATMQRLAASADVFASTYRPAVNQRFGLLPAPLAAASERGIVYMSANAYGHSGPWQDRPGFDQNAQVASGFAMAEGQGGPPKFSPVFYLADLITGYFAAAGMMAALHRRAIEGGSYQVKLSLARSAMWVQELGLLDVAAQGEVPETDSYPAETVSIDTAYGAVTLLAPPLTFTNLTLPDTDRLVPYGADPAAWPSTCCNRLHLTIPH